MRNALLLFVFLAGAAILGAQQPKTVFMITDAEGVAGVCRQEQAETSNTEMQRLLTGEINAAVEGFLEAGADEVWVWDGHSNSSTLSALTIHPKARLVMGGLPPDMLMDRRFAAVAFVGQHARANRPGAVMAHSYSSLGYQKVTMNDAEVGEIETRAALAGAYGVPVVFLSGDKAAAEDLHAVVPDAAMAVVKEGIGYYPCISLSAPAAQNLIREKAAEGFRRRGQIKPYVVNGPVRIEVEVTTRGTPSPGTPRAEGIELIAPRTYRYSGKDFLEAWTRWMRR